MPVFFMVVAVTGRTRHVVQQVMLLASNLMLMKPVRFCLDPARPLVSEFGSRRFRLTREDAHVVHVLHTNAGFLGEAGPIGHADFCINGGQRQPGCKGHLMRISRCSHFMSSCYFAASVRRRLHIDAIPCDSTCPKQGRWGLRI
ncbi:Lipase member H [Papilio machaon]|uniref:Lipase member H n=1 Tax=Papilio machaon TaxID=76193 RepID=A0A194R0B0_PAPMA|nr:Lipase member H [Papilio machaon]